MAVAYEVWSRSMEIDGVEGETKKKKKKKRKQQKRSNRMTMMDGFSKSTVAGTRLYILHKAKRNSYCWRLSKAFVIFLLLLFLLLLSFSFFFSSSLDRLTEP